MLGALALAALINTMFGDWRGLIGDVVGYWTEFVRPATYWLFHDLLRIDPPFVFRWFSVKGDADWLYDYYAFGVIMALSALRVLAFAIRNREPFYLWRVNDGPSPWFMRAYDRGSLSNVDDVPERVPPFVVALLMLIPNISAIIFVWPLLVVVLFLRMVLSIRGRNLSPIRSSFMILSPVLFGLLFVALNYWVR